MPSEKKYVDAMSIQRRMVMELLGSVSNEVKLRESLDEEKDQEMCEEDESNETNVDVSGSPKHEERTVSPFDDSNNINDMNEIGGKNDLNVSEDDYMSDNDSPNDQNTFKNESIIVSSKESIEEMLRRAKAFTKNRVQDCVDVPDCELPTNACSLNFSHPKVVSDFEHHFVNNEFTKGCKWSPDGRYLLSLGSDQSYRVTKVTDSLVKICNDEKASIENYDLPDPQCLKVGELSYDYHWYPMMNADDPSSCCFISSSRGMPVHLWNITTGSVCYSYRPFNHLDELAPAYSLGFSRDGALIICGFKKAIRIFRTNKPGRDCTTICGKKQNGVISCFDFHPHLHNLFAAGSYLGNVGLYNIDSSNLFSILDGQGGGVTQVLFSEDGFRLYSGARMDDELLCWDIRSMGTVLASYRREVNTNQRVTFSLSPDQKHLVSGSTTGHILSWDLSQQSSSKKPIAPTESLFAGTHCVNGVSLHPSLPLLAAASGQRGRHCEESQPCHIPHRGTVKLWTLT